MMDFASISKLNMRVFPPGRGSLYLDVSSRVKKGRPASSSLRIHFTLALPSQPGRRSRAGYPFEGRSASPFWAYAMSASSQAFATGCCGQDRGVDPGEKPRDSASALFAKRSASGTPVHSLTLVRPSMSWGVRSPFGSRNASPPFPEHSRKRSRDTEGKRSRSARVKIVGRRQPVNERCSVRDRYGDTVGWRSVEIRRCHDPGEILERCSRGRCLRRQHLPARGLERGALAEIVRRRPLELRRVVGNERPRIARAEGS
jgi:hypothetical protein